MKTLTILYAATLLDLDNQGLDDDFVKRVQMPRQTLIRNAAFPSDWGDFGQLMEKYAQDGDDVLLSLYLGYPDRCEFIIHPCTGLDPSQNLEEGEGIGFKLSLDQMEALHRALGKILEEMKMEISTGEAS